MSLQIYIAIILITVLGSCQGQNKPEQLNIDLTQSEEVMFESIRAIQKVDTVLTRNAPSKMTRKIRKDNHGNLLFASYQDIIKYDGVSFTKLKKEKSLDSYDAFDVWEDINGRIWIASTHFGVFQFLDSTEFKSNKKPINHFTVENGLSNNRTMCLYEDASGGVWIGTEGGVSYCDKNKIKKEQVTFRNFTVKDGLTDNSINTIMEDKSGKMWVGTRGGLSVLDPLTRLKKGKEIFTEITNNQGKPFENIWAIFEDTKGNIWLGGQYGLWCYDRKSFTKLTSVNVMSICEDKKGNIWFTHGANFAHKTGFSYYDQKSLLSSQPRATQVFIGGGMLWGMTIDKNEAIWVGKLNGALKYDGNSVIYFRNRD